MSHGVEVTELFGIGTKYEIACNKHQKLAVIVRNDGIRELYSFDANDPENPRAIVRLDEEEARRVVAIMGKTFFGD